MNKTQVVAEIIRVYDENEQLKRDVEEAERIQGSAKVDKFDIIDKLCKNAGFLKCFYSTDYYAERFPKVCVKDDSNQMNFITFDQWFTAIGKDTLQYGRDESLLNVMSFNEIKDYFRDQLKATYDELVNKKRGEILTAAKEAKK